MPGFDKDAVLAAMTGRFDDFFSQFTAFKLVGGELRGPCPLHGGTHPNFAVSPETGLWNCFSGCQDGGDVFRFVELREGISFPDALARVAAFAGVSEGVAAPASSSGEPRRPAAAPTTDVFLNESLAATLHERLMKSDGMRVWLSEHRGLTTETLTQFQIGMQKDELGLYRITFPVLDAEGRLLNIRRHLFAYKEGIDRTFKTLPWEKGLRAGLFPAASLVGASEVLLVEGEADAALACQMGFAAVTGTGGAGTWKPEWTDALRGCQRVTLLYDGDQAGRDGAQKAATALAAAVPDVRLAWLPEGEDLTSWVVDKGKAAADVQQAIDQAVPFVSVPATPAEAKTPETKPPEAKPKPAGRKSIAERIIDLADVQPPTDLPLMWGQYLLKGASHWLTGQTGLGKSTLLFNIACALAEGTTLWGIECETTRVLYCDMESGDVGRSHKIERLYRDTPRVRGQLLFLREPIKLPEELPELLNYVRAIGVELVVFDTARRCFSVKDENDNAEVYNRVIPTLDALKQAGVATLTMGHPSKSGNGSARGAGAQEDAGDVNLSLTMHRGEVSDPDGVIALRVTKNRLLGLGVPPLYLKRIGNDQFERSEAADTVPAEEPLSKQLQCRLAILDALDTAGKTQTHGELLDKARAAGFSKPTFDRAFKRMRDENDVAPAADGYARVDPFA